MTSSARSALIVGCGYLGLRVGARLQDAGLGVTGTARSEERCESIRAAGFDATTLDLASLGEAQVLDREFGVVVYCVAAGRGGDARLAYLDGPLACLDRVTRDNAARFVFVSSTGVYDQNSGEELDEESPIAATEPPHSILVAAESALRERDAIVARLGGLYGPGRSPVDWVKRPEFRERLRKSRHAYMNWIHIEDAANVVAAAAQRGRPGEVYLGVDGHPVTRGDFFDLATELASVARLELLDDPNERGKRLSSRKAQLELEVEMRYPDYRAGLLALARDDC